jgi:hypothetical protein
MVIAIFNGLFAVSAYVFPLFYVCTFVLLACLSNTRL